MMTASSTKERFQSPFVTDSAPGHWDWDEFYNIADDIPQCGTVYTSPDSMIMCGECAPTLVDHD